MENPSEASLLDSDLIQGPMGQYGDAAPQQILSAVLLRRFPVTQVEFGDETSDIGKFVSLALHPYKYHQNPSPYATCASI